jgi:hypothetical protein
MEHNFSHVDVNEMEELHGELFDFSDHKVGQRICYRLGENTYSGEILWVAAPGDLLDQHVPMSYIVLRDMPDNIVSFPDVVYRTDVEDSTDELL